MKQLKTTENGLDLSHLDELNRSYFEKLLHLKKTKSMEGKRSVVLKEDGKSSLVNGTLVIPTALMPEEKRATLPIIHYPFSEDKKTHYRKQAKDVTLWFRPMQAGTGSSIKRDRYLKEFCNRGRPGAKGTDLYIRHTKGGKSKNISLAELQILKIFALQKERPFKKVIFQNIVGQETYESVREIWKRPSLLDFERTYLGLFNSEKNPVEFFEEEVFQAYYPTFNGEHELTTNRLAPGGHALFAIEALLACLDEKKRPEGDDLIGVLSNGEDLCAFPSSDVVGMMKAEEIPILMVMTEKTHIDVKGGQLALFQDWENETLKSEYMGLFEKAQADQIGQGDLFKKIGLRAQDSMGLFNTNMALINYPVLASKLQTLVELEGEEFVKDLFAPHLIENVKNIRMYGVDKSFTQLEGALGSVLLNLDRYWRERFGKGLVSFLCVPADYRNSFFSPIKNAFDFYMQFHSDRFQFNWETFSLKASKNSPPPEVDLPSLFYSDLTNVLNCFFQARIKNLDKLFVVRGAIDFSHMQLSGHVEVTCDFNGVYPLKEALVKDGLLEDFEKSNQKMLFINDKGELSLFVH